MSSFEGKVFKNREALYKAGLHNSYQKGIGKSKDGQNRVSIVLSGGYIDDEDYGNEIIYTGEGGRDPKSKSQIEDQKLEGGNLDLLKAFESREPIYVTRGHTHKSEYSPKNGYQFFGNFYISEHWNEKGRDGFNIIRFKLVKDPKKISNRATDTDELTSQTNKFNSNDRQLVVNFMQQLSEEKKLGKGKLQLLPGISHGLLRDSKNGFMYLIFGGVGDLHGIKEDLNGIDQAYKSMKPAFYGGNTYSYGSLVLAVKDDKQIVVFTGDLQEFLNSRDKLIRSSAGDYQFHHIRSGDTLVIRETGLELGYFSSIPLSNFEDEKDMVFEVTEKIVHTVNLSDTEEALKQYAATAPPERFSQVVHRVVRNPKIAQLVKERANFTCEACGLKPFIQKNGKPYAEADHIKPLGGSYKGLDTPENMRCLCAQCHAIITHGSEEEIIKILRSNK